jgi:hypothetical protein
MVIGLVRGELELEDEPVNLVDDEDRPELVVPRLSEDRDRLRDASDRRVSGSARGRTLAASATDLRADTLNSVDEDKCAVTQP